jgi:hypothetical protein
MFILISVNKDINMIKLINKTLVIIAAAGLLFAGCTDRFEEFNKNPNGTTNEDILGDIVPSSLKIAQQNIYVYQPAWITQLQQNLMGDVYSGYMMPPTPFRGNNNNMTYDLVDGWNSWAFIPAYDNVMKPISIVEELTAEDAAKQDLYAMAKIVKVEAMHRISDIYGPIIYTKYRKIEGDGSILYDSQEEAYNAFFADLKTAIDILTPMVAAGTASTGQFKSSDLVYGGSYAKWLKFANSLRLRLAIRLAKVDAAKAKTEGEAALANSGGLLATNADNFLVDFGTTNHPLNVINNEWADIRMGAPMESIMGGYDDPRLPKYFVPATDPAVTGEFKGIRNGINIDAKSRYQDYSKLITFANKGQLMTVAEVWFLKAEAAIRGWAGAGTAQANYESGIQASFDQHGVSAAFAAYKDDATSKPMEYEDPKAITAGQNDVLNGNVNLSTITIKWDEGAAFETKLERIITQKWIAMYPDGQEAWSEFRRTGYPKLFPIVVNNSGGKISGFIKRVNFIAEEYATNKPAVTKAVELLDGPDTGGTPLWWDVD